MFEGRTGVMASPQRSSMNTVPAVTAFYGVDRRNTSVQLVPRLLYFSFLTNFSNEETRQFWHQYPILIDDQRPSEREFLSYLCQDKPCPPDYFAGVARGFEEFLSCKGLHPESFLQTDVLPLLKGTIFSSSTIAGFIRPFLRSAYSYPDIREFGLDFVQEIGPRLIPHSAHSVLWKERQNDEVVYYLSHSFGAETVDINVDVWIKNLVASIPSMLSAPDFDCVDIVGDPGSEHGASSVLSRVMFRLKQLPVEKSLDAPVDEAIMLRGQVAARLHHRLVETLSEKYVCQYRKDSECFIVNDRKVLTRAPARMLAMMLESHLDTGKTEFAMKCLRADESVAGDVHKEPSVNIRLIRLQEALERKAPLLSVKRLIGEGRVILEPHCEIELTVVDG